MNRIWLNQGDIDDIINSIGVKDLDDKENRFRIDVWEYSTFIFFYRRKRVWTRQGRNKENLRISKTIL